MIERFNGRIAEVLATTRLDSAEHLADTIPRVPTRYRPTGMIERFNGRIAEVLATTRLDSAEHLADTIKRYVKVYNQHIPQTALGHSPPLQAMKNWSQKQTQLFKKCAYNLAGLDS